MKVIYPNAMVCGCPPDLFWKLNPNSLEPFYEKHRLEMEHEANMAEWTAWRTGYYDMLAVASVFSKNQKYPQNPQIHEEVDTSKPAMTDADRFKLYVAEFRKERRERDKLKQSHEPE